MMGFLRIRTRARIRRTVAAAIMKVSNYVGPCIRAEVSVQNTQSRPDAGVQNDNWSQKGNLTSPALETANLRRASVVP
jgi:hypothetical protein